MGCGVAQQQSPCLASMWLWVPSSVGKKRKNEREGREEEQNNVNITKEFTIQTRVLNYGVLTTKNKYISLKI